MLHDSISADEQAYRDIFDRLRARAPALARTSADERIAKLKRLYQAVYDLRGEIGEAGLEELGMDGRLALLPLKEEIGFVSERLAGWMEREEVEQVPSLMGRRGYIHWEPKGVVLHLATWNSPVLISLSPLVTMLAAGNAVVLKPSELAPLSADLVAKVIEKAGLTDDVAVVTGGPETAQALLKLPFNHVCYVGNNRVGRLVMEAAAKHFAGVTLEMGGKNPVIVERDADLDDAAAKISFGRHLVAGQVCLSPDYVLVHESVREPFVAALKTKIAAFYDPEGKGFQASPDLPRIVNTRHAARIKGLIDDAVAKGATVALGGEADVEARFVAPTVLENVGETMEIFHEEVFGPVLTVQGFSSREEAAREIAGRPNPLGLYIFTKDRATVDWYIDHTRAGSTAVNAVAAQANIGTLPFGGSNHSGIGRLGGRAGFREFSNGRGVVEDALDPAVGTPAAYPPFPPEMAAYVDHMLAPG
ncbi:aldehyde dehydrogenase family protein [Flavisphingomonas formosensis]|uniref:aldehyde dehydrogenase family protein n=1 Tax=Flavisphingomonas formosensis TaxID=861534 RepID=UPI0012FB67D1|nr:aldehyde dehydrogenase family protein [Sphingomonas formosensis]